MENSLGLVKQMEERWSEAEVVTKQIVELRERKENLREEINGLRNVWGYHRFLGGVSEDYLEDLRAGIVRRHDKVKKLKGQIRRLGKREKDLEDEATMLKMLVMDIERKISVSVRDTKEVEEMKGEEDKSLGSMRFEYRGLIQASFAQSIVKVMGPDKH
jgi:chromosome segregation ATPase